MLALAGREADGVILYWLSADDLKQVLLAARSDERNIDVVDRIMVCPNPDSNAVRAAAKPLIAAYLNVPVYANLSSLARP